MVVTVDGVARTYQADSDMWVLREDLTPVPSDDAGIITDIDTPDDLHRADLEATGAP